MRLARVVHDRCGEYDFTTYLMVPDDWDEDMLHAAVMAAKIAYDQACSEFLNSDPPPIQSLSDFRKAPPEMTIGEYREREAKAQRAHKEWERKRSQAQNNFGHWLHEAIPGSKHLFDSPALSDTVRWGHQHGRKIDYGDREKDDFPGSVKRFSID